MKEKNDQILRIVDPPEATEKFTLAIRTVAELQVQLKTKTPGRKQDMITEIMMVKEKSMLPPVIDRNMSQQGTNL